MTSADIDDTEGPRGPPVRYRTRRPARVADSSSSRCRWRRSSRVFDGSSKTSVRRLPPPFPRPPCAWPRLAQGHESTSCGHSREPSVLTRAPRVTGTSQRWSSLRGHSCSQWPNGSSGPSTVGPSTIGPSAMGRSAAATFKSALQAMWKGNARPAAIRPRWESSG